MAAAGAGAGLVGATGFAVNRAGAPSDSALASALTTSTPDATPTATPPPTPTPIPEPPVMPRGREDLVLMQGTDWEATGTIFHSGVAGPRFMVLGGVHGNEPGGWLAAESVAEWEVQRGMLIVLPRLNWRSAAQFVRTLDEAGDLNRLYPGDANGLPMAQMAAQVTALATTWRPHWLWDMHESWGFYNERGANSGTAFIGQTVTIADLERAEDVRQVLLRVNAEISPREEFMMRARPGGNFGGGNSSDDDSSDGGNSFQPRGRGRSSLSMGTHVPGVSPVLIEMGQMDQSELRRSELHQLLVRSMLEHLGSV